MSKFSTTLRKSKKSNDNCLVIGSGFGFFTDIVSFFRSTFIVAGDNISVRAKNIIYKENFVDFYTFPNIDFIFIDFNKLEMIKEIQDVIVRSRPLIYIGHGNYLDKELVKYFQKLGLELVHINKKFQIWQAKK